MALSWDTRKSESSEISVSCFDRAGAKRNKRGTWTERERIDETDSRMTTILTFPGLLLLPPQIDLTKVEWEWIRFQKQETPKYYSVIVVKGTSERLVIMTHSVCSKRSDHTHAAITNFPHFRTPHLSFRTVFWLAHFVLVKERHSEKSRSHLAPCELSSNETSTLFVTLFFISPRTREDHARKTVLSPGKNQR